MLLAWCRGSAARTGRPGDLHLDPAVPEDERVTTSCGAWLAQATHVWTGTGWCRLGSAPVHPVPRAAPARPVALLQDAH